ncbi:MAG: MATE family efflux transporter [Clostridiales bacterium]|nr:MATE family efflux transporter [Clostridiales bacterium]
MMNAHDFGRESISRILLKLAPPVMIGQLIQALYNIVDSFFVGRYSDSGLTALSIVYPVQLLMIALAVGTGVGINTVISARMGVGDRKGAKEIAGMGTPLALVLWAVFSLIVCGVLPAYARLSSQSEVVVRDVIDYGRIVCIGSVSLFLESIWTKVMQARGDMKTPMLGQVVGAVTNIALDAVLIFGVGEWKGWGISGAALATVLGQTAAAAVMFRRGYAPSPALKKYRNGVRQIFRLGLPNMLMQSAYTLYVFGLNMILVTFSDQAVTALGLYYKWQTFFFLPMGALETCIVPIISYNFAAGKIKRCHHTMRVCCLWAVPLMGLGTLCFAAFPEALLRVFSQDSEVIRIGVVGFRWIGASFMPLITSLVFPVFFQAVGQAAKSSVLTLVRTVLLFVPLGYIFSRFGLDWFWLTFPVTEVLTTLAGLCFYVKFMKKHIAWEKPARLGGG